MKNTKKLFCFLGGLSSVFGFLLTCLLILPAIDQNSMGEYCSYISEGAKEVANWSAQGQPCRINSQAIIDFLGFFFCSSIVLFILFVPLSLLIFAFFKIFAGEE